MNSLFIDFIQKHSIKFNLKRDIGFSGKILYKSYHPNKRIRKRIIFWLFRKIIGEHYEFYSRTLRQIYKDYHDVEVGEYSHGGCFNLNASLLPRGTKVGRYCSIARTVSIHDANHPHNIISSHGFFFNTSLGIVKKDILSYTALSIGNDVYIGHNAIILPSCSSIGDGAVIGAGCVINKNIPPYAIVVGNPCRIVSYRFSKEKIIEILENQWWNKPIWELTDQIDDFQTPLESNIIR